MIRKFLVEVDDEELEGLRQEAYNDGVEGPLSAEDVLEMSSIIHITAKEIEE